jgi:hypothetical protein
MRRLLLTGFALQLALLAFGQKDDQMDRASIIEQRIEQIAEVAEDENLDYNTIFEQLAVYLDFPLNMNDAQLDDLAGLALLSNFQIIQLLEYRKEYGELFSIYEMAQINGWTYATVELIAPFIKVAPVGAREKITFKKMLNYGKHEVVARWQRVLEEQEGYKPIDPDELEERPNARYLGSPDKLFTRYRYRYGDNISFGFTAEKDNGEEFFRGSQPQGFDFFSAHLYLKNIGRLKALSIGDYQAQFGQGLTFWSGLGFNRKSSFTTSIAQLGRGITPYTSINENLFLRGGAATLEFGDFHVTAFYSGKRIDGNIIRTEGDSLDELGQELLVSSFQESGFHRTRGEIEDKNAIFQEHFGGNIRYRTSNFQLGLTGVHMRLDGAINRNTALYSQFRFQGRDNTAIGADYLWKYRNFSLFGETTQTANGALGTINGLNINMNSRLTVNVTQRYFARDFQPVASVAFGEGTQPENESGVYFGVEFRPFKKWRLNAFFDQFRFPWLRYQTDAPSAGHDFLAQVDFMPSSRLAFYLRYRQRNRLINSREESEGAKFLVENPRENVRLNMSFSASRQFQLRSRIEFTRFERGNEPVSNGFLLFQDFIYRPNKIPLAITMRYALFQTDNFDSRIFAFENDVLYLFSIPQHSGRGSRVFVMAKYDLARNVDLWVRWSQFYYTDRQVVGSGLEAIDGNTRSDIRVQVRWVF